MIKRKLLFLLTLLALLCVLVLLNPIALSSLDLSLVETINSSRLNSANVFINFLSNLATPMLIAVIVILFIIYKVTRVDFYLLAFKQMFIAFVFCASFTFIIKNTIQRVRPFNVSSVITKLGSGGSYSFPSGHSADAFLLFFAILMLFPKNNLLKSLAFVWAIFIAYSRMYLGVHYLTDIIASILIATISVLVVMRNPSIQNYKK